MCKLASFFSQSPLETHLYSLKSINDQVDMTGDGLKELVVVTTRGVQVHCTNVQLTTLDISVNATPGSHHRKFAWLSGYCLCGTFRCCKLTWPQ